MFICDFLLGAVGHNDVIQLIDDDDGCFEQPILIDLSQKSTAILRHLNSKTKIERRQQDKEKSPGMYQLRKYQAELLAPVLDGLNTIICAPTGSGKTIVAAEIVDKHLAKPNSSTVVFTVPTVALVDQQTTLLKDYLSKKTKVIVRGISGGATGVEVSDADWALISQSCDVVVLTPQLLLNGLVSSKVTMDDVSLLLFDECHHTNKKHPYNEIMKIYFQHKVSKGKLPQVVGLTASLGVGEAKNKFDAIDHILTISANLDAQALSTVKENLEELQQFVHMPLDVVCEVPCVHETHAFSKLVVNLMLFIERSVKDLFDILQDDNKKPFNADYDIPARKWGQEYQTWLYSWIHFAPSLLQFDLARSLRFYLAQLEACHLSLDIIAHLPFSYTCRFLSDFVKDKLSDFELEKEVFTIFSETLSELHLLADSDSARPNLLDKLKSVLLQDELAQSADSRILIFVRTCQIAQLLEKCLNEDADLKHFNAARLTGVNTKRVEGGQTSSEQKERMLMFRTGLHRVVIATTVVEEGLDVQQCNLVIKYNHSTNEIGHVQRRGRGRALKSKSILITHDRSVAERERANIDREQWMHYAIDLVKSKGQQWFSAQMEINYNLREGVVSDQLDIAATMPSTSKYMLKCINCDQNMLTSDHVKLSGSQFVCVDPSIWSKLCHRSLVATGGGSKVLCKCRTTFGTILQYERSAYLPVISIKAFVLFCPRAQKKYNVRKWQDVLDKHFEVEPMQRLHAMTMTQALRKLLAEIA